MERLEQLWEGFKRNLSQGIACELTYDGEKEVALWTSKSEGYCGLMKLEEKGEKEHAGSQASHRW